LAKAWKYIEPVVGLGCALLGVPPLAIVGAVNGAKLIAAVRENWDGRSLDFDALASAMRMAALRAADRFDVDQAARDALTEADAAMADHLVSCLPKREELAAFARKPDLAATVASHVVDRLAAHDPRFAESASSVAGFDARSFATEIVQSVIEAALANNDYRQSLTTYLQIETLQGVARLEDGMAEVLEFVRAQKAGASLTDEALRGAIARFIAFQPDASDADVLNAVETFERDYRALLEQVSHISVNDNHIQSLKVAAEEALEAGDIATARTRYGEAAKAAADKASEPVRNAAALKSAEASTALTMLDWQAADAAWEQAAAMLMPFDLQAGEVIVWEAAERLQQFGETFAQTPALVASERRWRALEIAAVAGGDNERVAAMQVWLGNVLQVQGERTGGDAGLARLGEAVDAYRAALSVYTQAAMPADWAMTQNNLGNVLQTQGVRTGGDAGLALLGAAVDAYGAALTVWTLEYFSHYHELARNNLAQAEAVIAARRG
jgi:tetratricopeptide (TPR) repeat protein